MSDWIYRDNEYLTVPEMRNNAKIFSQFFVERGWTKNAIAAMLGNIEVESTINPHLWQGRETPPDPLATNNGYGLTQWTPARKLIDWATIEDLDYTDGYTQMQRILYEHDNNLQWSTDNILNMTWQQFSISTESPETLARVFVWAYEQPADPDIPLRQSNARKWYNFLSLPPVWLLFKMSEVNHR